MTLINPSAAKTQTQELTGNMKLLALPSPLVNSSLKQICSNTSSVMKQNHLDYLLKPLSANTFTNSLFLQPKLLTTSSSQAKQHCQSTGTPSLNRMLSPSYLTVGLVILRVHMYSTSVPHTYKARLKPTAALTKLQLTNPVKTK